MYVSYYREPAEAQGAIRIATNKKIPVTIVGKDDINTELDLGGMYVITGSDLKGFINAAQEVK